MAEIHSRTLRKIGRFPHLTGWLNLIGAILGAGAVAIAVYFYGAASYQATTSLLFLPPNGGAGGVSSSTAPAAAEATPSGGTESASANLVNADKFMLLLQSRTLQDALIQKYQLAERLGLDLGYTREVLPHMLKVTPVPGTGLTIALTTEGCRFPIKGSWFVPALDHDDARKLCADLANGCVEELRAEVTGINSGQARANYEFYRQNARQTHDRLRAVETRLQSLQSRERFLDPQGKAGQLLDRVKAIEAARDTAQARRQELSRSLAEARTKLTRADALAVSSKVETRNPVIGSLEQKLADLSLERAAQLARGKTEQQREVALLTAEIADLERQRAGLCEAVLKEVATSANPAYTDLLHSVTGQEVELAGVVARERAYAGLLVSANRGLSNLPPVSRTYASFQRERETLVALAAGLDRQLEEAALQAKSAARDPFYVLDRAVLPEYGYGPYVGRAALVAFGALFALLWLITGIKRGVLDFFRL
jgi:uncharacterized protein involved in exopolysaccharide biosynthesis